MKTASLSSWGWIMARHTKNKGLAALIQVTQVNPARLSAYHIGFVIGPCFNAAGRLDTVKIALDLLLSEDDEKAALAMASQLKELNESRWNRRRYRALNRQWA